MACYFIGRLTMKDPSWIDEYVPGTQALVEKHGGRYLVSGGAMELCEGDLSLPDSTVVLEFPNKDAAMAWYKDPDYQPLIALRQSGSNLDLLFVEGA